MLNVTDNEGFECNFKYMQPTKLNTSQPADDYLRRQTRDVRYLTFTRTYTRLFTDSRRPFAYLMTV